MYIQTIYMAKQISKEITSELQFSQSQRMDVAHPAAPEERRAGALCPGSEPEGPELFKSLGRLKGQKTA